MTTARLPSLLLAKKLTPPPKARLFKKSSRRKRRKLAWSRLLLVRCRARALRPSSPPSGPIPSRPAARSPEPVPSQNLPNPKPLPNFSRSVRMPMVPSQATGRPSETEMITAT